MLRRKKYMVWRLSTYSDGRVHPMPEGRCYTLDKPTPDERRAVGARIGNPCATWVFQLGPVQIRMTVRQARNRRGVFAWSKVEQIANRSETTDRDMLHLLERVCPEALAGFKAELERLQMLMPTEGTA